MKYRIKFGTWHTAERVYEAGETIELTEAQAAGFADKLEPVAAEPVSEQAAIVEQVTVKLKTGKAK